MTRDVREEEKASEGETRAETGRCACDLGTEGDFWLQEKWNGWAVSNDSLPLIPGPSIPSTSLSHLWCATWRRVLGFLALTAEVSLLARVASL